MFMDESVSAGDLAKGIRGEPTTDYKYTVNRWLPIADYENCGTLVDLWVETRGIITGAIVATRRVAYARKSSAAPYPWFAGLHPVLRNPLSEHAQYEDVITHFMLIAAPGD